MGNGKIKQGIIWNYSDFPLEYLVYGAFEEIVKSTTKTEIAPDFEITLSGGGKVKGFSYSKDTQIVSKYQEAFVQVPPKRYCTAALHGLKKNQHKLSIRLRVGQFEKYILKNVVIKQEKDLFIQVASDFWIHNMTYEEVEIKKNAQKEALKKIAQKEAAQKKMNQKKALLMKTLDQRQALMRKIAQKQEILKTINQNKVLLSSFVGSVGAYITPKIFLQVQNETKNSEQTLIKMPDQQKLMKEMVSHQIQIQRKIEEEVQIKNNMAKEEEQLAQRMAQEEVLMNKITEKTILMKKENTETSGPEKHEATNYQKTLQSLRFAAKAWEAKQIKSFD